MKKAVAFFMVGVFLAASLFVSPASALPPFKKAFEDKYVTNSSSTDFQAAFKTASCNTCHVKGKEKTARNAYGKYPVFPHKQQRRGDSKLSGFSERTAFAAEQLFCQPTVPQRHVVKAAEHRIDCAVLGMKASALDC